MEAGQSRLDNWSPEEKPHLYGGIVQLSFTNNFIHLQAASLMYRQALTFAPRPSRHNAQKAYL